MLKLYRGTGPGSVLMTLLTAVAVWWWPLLHPVDTGQLATGYDMPLYELLLRVVGTSATGAALLAFVTVFLLALYLSNFNTRLFFITERTLLPSALFVLYSGFFTGAQLLTPAIPASILLVLALDRLIASYRKPGVAYNFFDASLMIGIASLFWFNIIWFFPVVIIGILLIRTFNLKELFISVFGLATPYLVLVAIYYIAGIDAGTITEKIAGNISHPAADYFFSPATITFIIVNTLLQVGAIIHLARLFNIKKIKTRKIFSLLIWLEVFCIAVYFAVPSVSVELVYILMIPAGFLLTHLIVFTRNKKIANLVFAIVILSVAVVQVTAWISRV